MPEISRSSGGSTGVPCDTYGSSTKPRRPFPPECAGAATSAANEVANKTERQPGEELPSIITVECSVMVVSATA